MNNGRRYRGVVSCLALTAVLVWCVLLLVPDGAMAQGSQKDGGQVEMNFRNVEMGKFLSLMSRAFDIPFVWDDSVVRGQITLESHRKFSKEDAFKLFETILYMHGYTTVQGEGSPVVRVVPIQDAARLPTRINPKREKGGGGNVFVTRIIPLKFADPAVLQQALAPLMSKSAAVAVYAPLNSLIISDTEENLQRIAKIIKEMDISPGEGNIVVIPLKYASAKKLAPLFKSVAGEVRTGQPKRGAARTAPGGTRGVLIIAEERTNSLVISADPAQIAQLRRLIKVLDVPGRFEDGGFKIYRPQYASATNLAKILKDINRTTKPKAPTPRAGARAEQPVGMERPDVVITADRPTNILIVFAPPEVIETFDKLIAVLDVPGRTTDNNFKIYRLEYAAASELARILQDVKRTMAADSSKPGQRQPAAGAAPRVSSLILITADIPTNSLIVFAPPEVMDTIDPIVAALDVPGRSRQANFKIYSLEYASAESLATILRDVKTVAERGGLGGDAQSQKGRPGPVILITADQATNSLIVFATPEIIETMDLLVETLDIPGRKEVSTFKVYKMEHASAEDMAETLNQVKQGAESVAQAGQPARTGAAARAAGRTPTGLTIVADKATNTLIVFGTSEMIATMTKIVAQLDVRRPQVYVEMLIMEVTLEKSLELGINWRGAGKVGDSVVGGGFPDSQPQTLDESLAGGTGAVLGIIGDQIQFQGQSFTSFSAFIAATRQDQDLNILANPQILTLDNEEAEINVSQVIPISSKVVRDANLQTTTEFVFKDVGIILNIKPQITGGDKVLLSIRQESSSVSSRQTTISSDQTAITTLKRTINTKVLIDNKATMAIGGLIQDQEELTITKVPCLGDIPVLGWFFKTRSEKIRKTNLIVFLRPHIINTREDLEEVTRGARTRFDNAKNSRGDTEERIREEFEVSPDLPATPLSEESAEDE